MFPAPAGIRDPRARVGLKSLDPHAERGEAERRFDEVERDVNLMPPPEGAEPRVPRPAVDEIGAFRGRRHPAPRPETLRERDEPHHTGAAERRERQERDSLVPLYFLRKARSPTGNRLGVLQVVGADLVAPSHEKKCGHDGGDVNGLHD